MISIKELRANPYKRFRIVVAAFMVPMLIGTLAAFRDVLEGTASGPFHGEIPLILSALALLAFAMMWFGARRPKGQQNS